MKKRRRGRKKKTVPGWNGDGGGKAKQKEKGGKGRGNGGEKGIVNYEVAKKKNGEVRKNPDSEGSVENRPRPQFVIPVNPKETNASGRGTERNSRATLGEKPAPKANTGKSGGRRLGKGEEGKTGKRAGPRFLTKQTFQEPPCKQGGRSQEEKIYR